MSDPASSKSAPKKRSAPTSSTPKNCTNELVALTKAIAALNKSLDEQDKRAETLKEFLGDSLKDWHTKLEAARHAFDIEDEDMRQTKKRREVEHELDIRSHGRTIAIKLLEEDGYTAIRTEEAEALRSQVLALQERADAIEETTRTTVKAELIKDHQMEVKEINLTNQAKVAQLSEQNKLLNVQISDLKQTIIDLRKDVTSTQEMVKEFAGKPTVVKTMRDRD